jgi:hypothetical protein
MHAREALVTRNSLAPDTRVPCLTFIRRPADRLLSLFYYWLRDGGVRRLRVGARTWVWSEQVCV